MLGRPYTDMLSVIRQNLYTKAVHRANECALTDIRHIIQARAAALTASFATRAPYRT
jgi:hypothetical protein